MSREVKEKRVILETTRAIIHILSAEERQELLKILGKALDRIETV